MSSPVPPDDWRAFAAAVLERSGLPAEPAAAVGPGPPPGAPGPPARPRPRALLAHNTPPTRAAPRAPSARREVVADTGTVTTWDARRLPGVWTTMLAVDEAVSRSARFGISAVALRRSHHIACLAAYLEAPARAGHLVLVFSSDPSDAHVAPFGGLKPLITPDPIAAGIPAAPDPVLVDISASITTAGMVAKTRAAGGRLKGAWLIDAAGRPTDDPNALKAGGALLPVGGLDHGHKGFGLGLLVEALTQGLSGHGRADQPKDWGAAVLVLAFAPARFAGLDPFLRQTTWLAEACRANPPADPARPVRLPGALALARKRQAEADGLVLDPAILPALRVLAARFGVALPAAAR